SPPPCPFPFDPRSGPSSGVYRARQSGARGPIVLRRRRRPAGRRRSEQLASIAVPVQLLAQENPFLRPSSAFPVRDAVVEVRLFRLLSVRVPARHPTGGNAPLVIAFAAALPVGVPLAQNAVPYPAAIAIADLAPLDQRVRKRLASGDSSLGADHHCCENRHL